MTELSYLTAHRDARRRLAAGEQQYLCEHCRRYHWQTVGCPEACAVALRVVEAIDSSLIVGPTREHGKVTAAIYRRRSDGRLLSHLDEVIRAISDDDLAVAKKEPLF